MADEITRELDEAEEVEAEEEEEQEEEGGEEDTSVVDSALNWRKKWTIPLNVFKGAKRWRSILIGEDLLVAVLKKSVRRHCVDLEMEPILIPDDLATQAVRDVVGQLIVLMRSTGDREAAKSAIDIVEKALASAGTGSGDGDKLAPPPNP